VQSKFQLHPTRSGLRNPAAKLANQAHVTGTLPSSERQRRLHAAPVGLLLLGWGLGLGPLAHAVIAHGEPLLHESGDASWVQHADAKRPGEPPPREAAPAHHHAPGAIEHLQLAISAGAPLLTVAVVLLRVELAELITWQAPVLPRWRLPEVPGAP
jgi:hypothetical protein